ncbi:MAG: (2Fe-2S) ferredoxin domain-containing protein [Magnetospirillum sp. WYHS-4]
MERRKGRTVINKITSLIVCVNLRPAGYKPSCAARGSRDLADRIEEGLRARGIALVVERICCLGHCKEGPAVRFAPGGEFLLGVTEADLPHLLDMAERLCAGRPEPVANPLADLPPPGT